MPKPNKGAGGGSGSISGNKRDNNLTGTENAELIDGKGGNDLLLGLGGADTLQGGSSSDTLDGGAGNDSIDGGTGSDTVVFSANRSEYLVVDRVKAMTSFWISMSPRTLYTSSTTHSSPTIRC